MSCPKMDDFRNYRTWKRACLFWGATTEMNSREKARKIIITLSDNAEGYPRGLATKCRENLAEAQIRTPEVEDVMDVLDEIMGRDDDGKAWRLYQDLDRCEIEDGEEYTAFVARFEAAWKALRNENENLVMCEEDMARKLKESAKLTPREAMEVEMNVRLGNGKIMKNTIKVMSELYSDQIYRGGATRVEAETGRTENTVTSGASRQREAEKQESQKGARGGATRAETVTEGTKSTATFGVIGRRETEKQKPQRSRHAEEEIEGACSCGRAEHTDQQDEGEGEWWWSTDQSDEESGGDEERKWEEEHPNKGKESGIEGSQATGGMERSETRCYSCGEMDHRSDKCTNTLLWEIKEEDSAADEKTMHESSNEMINRDEAEELDGWEIIDTKNDTSVAGASWFHKYQKGLSEAERREIMGPFATKTTIRFETGEEHKAFQKYVIPVHIRGKKTKVKVHIIAADIPLLISRSTTESIAAAEDIERSDATTRTMQADRGRSTWGGEKTETVRTKWMSEIDEDGNWKMETTLTIYRGVEEEQTRIEAKLEARKRIRKQDNGELENSRVSTARIEAAIVRMTGDTDEIEIIPAHMKIWVIRGDPERRLIIKSTMDIKKRKNAEADENEKAKRLYKKMRDTMKELGFGEVERRRPFGKHHESIMESTLEECGDGAETLHERTTQPGTEQRGQEQMEPSDGQRKWSGEKKHGIGLAEITREAPQYDTDEYRKARPGSEVDQAIGDKERKAEQKREATDSGTFKRMTLNRSTPQGTTLSDRDDDDQEPSDGHGRHNTEAA